MTVKDKFIKSLNKFFSEPVLILTIFPALLIFIFIILLRPFILFRFGFFHSDRLGHFTVNSEIFFCEDLHIRKEKKVIDFFIFLQNHVITKWPK